MPFNDEIPKPQLQAFEMEGANVPIEPIQSVGISLEIIKKIDLMSKVIAYDGKIKLWAARNKVMDRKLLMSFKTIATYPKTLNSSRLLGILSFDINKTNNNKILMGTTNRNVIMLNKETENMTILQGHKQKVTQVIYHQNEDILITGSPDSTIKIWNIASFPTSQTIAVHDGSITSMSLHPTGDDILTTSTDQKWAFSDILTGRLLTTGSRNISNYTLTTGQFHPIGLFFGTGTSDSHMVFWDIRSQLPIASKSFHENGGPISAMSFSDNCTYLATSATYDNCVKLWDLRKIQSFKTLNFDDNYVIKDLCFDRSGTYLGVAGTDVRIYVGREWNELKVFKDHTALVTGVRFGINSQFVASSSLDGTLKCYGI